METPTQLELFEERFDVEGFRELLRQISGLSEMRTLLFGETPPRSIPVKVIGRNGWGQKTGQASLGLHKEQIYVFGLDGRPNNVILIEPTDRFIAALEPLTELAEQAG